MIVIENLDPKAGVPDALYEVLHWEPSSCEEDYAGRVLRVHRDWLNGGFQQVLSNLVAIEEPVEPYIEAYHNLELIHEAELVHKASLSFSNGALTEEQWDELDNQYELLVYGADRHPYDAIEEMVILFIQKNADQFESAVERSND